MKKLILSIVLSASTLYAADTSQPEIVDPQDGKRIVAQIKDLQVQQMLDKTSEFQKCRDKNKFEASDVNDLAKRSQKIADAEKCIKDELGQDKSGEKLKELSDALNLQHYGLIQSKNVTDIKNYLADKMYQSLTGIDRKNPNPKELLKSMKFKNRKHVDQKVFIDMYRTQLGKNGLFEISRFCFEDLRSADPAAAGKTSFGSHWADYKNGRLKQLLKDGMLKDSGSPPFGKDLGSPDDKSIVYKEIFNSIAVDQLSDQQMSDFFLECGSMIVQLCEQFKSSQKNNLDKDATSQVNAGAAGGAPGAAACLAESRINNYRKALADVKKVEKQFEEMGNDSKIADALLSGEPIKLFKSGVGDNDSINDLTSATSSDFLEGGYEKDSNAKKKAEECEQNPELANCEGFISEGDELDKAKRTVELEMTLKREVEMARVRKLVQGDEKPLREYLEENGHFDLLNGDRFKTITADEMAREIGLSYEAKKIATLEQINRKLGKRQIAKGEDPDVIKDNALNVVKESKEERSRLAQVVLFNNIITSYLTLKRKDANGDELPGGGRNINAWKQEEKSLTAASVDPKLFENLKKSSDGAEGIKKEEEISGFELLDKILGKAD